jgi:beta-glucanase (GH16 family)
MKTLLLAVVAAVSVNAGDEWKLVWSDEFDYTGRPDPKRWTNEVGFVRNQEAQFYRAENARVENGKLIIEARQERFKNPSYRPTTRTNSVPVRRGRFNPEFAEYTSASLTTEKLASWKYGRVEVRAKHPQGRGVWPAIWMLGVNNRQVGWPRCGEIDIMEYVGFDPDTIHANIHTAKYNHVKKTGKGSQLKMKEPFNDFHNYVMEWFPDRMDFFVDEKKYFTFQKEADATVDAWPYDQPFYLMLNLAIGGEWGAQKGIDAAIFPQRYEIDYVRIYQTVE